MGEGFRVSNYLVGQDMSAEEARSRLEAKGASEKIPTSLEGMILETYMVSGRLEYVVCNPNPESGGKYNPAGVKGELSNAEYNCRDRATTL